ncbi:MAG TPA: hypothetical protein VG248_17370 [Caulobacteraceae bacterium]|jgi:hypothetical protein|nr:hypothetical protein [Caulobacteraceae bacterium]
MSDETKDRGGRPKMARGVATSSPKAGAPWSIRGVPQNVRGMANRAATARGATVGDWVSEAIVRHARSVLGEEPGEADVSMYDETEVSSDGKDLATIPPASAERSPDLEARLVEALDRQTRSLERQAREARRARWSRRR